VGCWLGFAVLIRSATNLKLGNIFYVAVKISADLKAAAKLGGLTVQGKTEIPNIGWYGIFKDPSGNRIGLYTSRNPEFNK
jgi:predicted enzyme related to lactoylglutathione lyase